MATYSRVHGHAHLIHLVLVVSTLLTSVYQYSFNSKQVGFSCKPAKLILKAITS